MSDSNRDATSVNTVVLGRYEAYRFAEPSIPERAQIEVLATPPVGADLPTPAALDPGLSGLHDALERQLARTPVIPIDHTQGRATTWLQLSPFELFLEQIVARKLGGVE